MELFLFCWALAWVIQRGVVDTTYAVRGQVSPRMRLKLAKARVTDPTARYGAGDYSRDLWSDTLSDLTERRRARKAKKASAGGRATATTEPWAAPVMPTLAPGSDHSDLGWMGFASEAGRHLISENRCAWGGGGQPFCGAPRDGDYQFCPQHARRYAAELGEHPTGPPVRRSRVRGTATTEPWKAPVMATPHVETAPAPDVPAEAAPPVPAPQPCQWGHPGGLHDDSGPCTSDRVEGHIYCWPHIRAAIVMSATDWAGGPTPSAGTGSVSEATVGGADKPRPTPSPDSDPVPAETTEPRSETPMAGTAPQGAPDYPSTYTDEERRYWSFVPASMRPEHFRREEEARAAAATKVAGPVPVETSATAGFPGPLATVTPINRTTHREDTTVTTTEHAPTGETVSLTSAMSYAESMAAAAEAGVASVEQSMAHLTTGEVTGEALTHLATAQEALSSAASAFTAAHQELLSHQSVQDAYNATPDAGNKAFVTGD